LIKTALNLQISLKDCGQLNSILPIQGHWMSFQLFLSIFTSSINVLLFLEHNLSPTWFSLDPHSLFSWCYCKWDWSFKFPSKLFAVNVKTWNLYSVFWFFLQLFLNSLNYPSCILWHF
jgi:hypothetical protein